MAITEKLKHGGWNVLFRNVELSRTPVFLWEVGIGLTTDGAQSVYYEHTVIWVLDHIHCHCEKNKNCLSLKRN